MNPSTLVGSATPWGAIAQAGIGLGQFIAGAIQRKKAEKAAQTQIGKLGPDAGILGYYNQALQKYSALRGGESALQKQYTRQSQQNLASALRGFRQLGSGGILAGGGSALRAADEGALRAAGLGEQLSSQALGRLGGAAQMAAAEKRRPEELRLQMMLQKAAGGSQIANVGMSNVFGALQSAATQKLYRDMYGVGGRSGTETTPESSLMGLSEENVLSRLLKNSRYKYKGQ